MPMNRLNPWRVVPQGLATLTTVERYLDECGLDPKLLALVAVRVSQINGCAYCLHVHTERARELGEHEVRLYLLDAWKESVLYSEGERTALEWADALTNIRESRAADDVYARARSRFSEKELADLSIAVAMTNAWNRLAIGARVRHPSDVPFAAHA
jgi:AhpD family alkylhydroperoxidase